GLEAGEATARLALGEFCVDGDQPRGGVRSAAIVQAAGERGVHAGAHGPAAEDHLHGGGSDSAAGRDVVCADADVEQGRAALDFRTADTGAGPHWAAPGGVL